MKKIFVIILLLSVLVLTSCSPSDGDRIIFSKTDENYGDTGGLNLPIDINDTQVEIMAVTDVDELADSLVIKELAKRTGLNINLLSISPSVVNRQIQLYLSTNELPDILCSGIDLSEINRLGKSGIFVPVNKYLNELPNFRKKIIENSDFNNIMDEYTSGDGNLYFFPRIEYQKEITHSFLMRKDIFDKNSLELWENKEEFYTTLKKLKELYPGSSPYVSQSGEKIFDNWAPSFGFEFPGMYYENSTGKWMYSAIHPGFEEMLKFIKRLYDEELIDRNFLNASSYIWDWKIIGENGFVTFGEILSVNKTSDEYRLFLAPDVSGEYKVYKNSLTGIGPVVTNNKNSLLSLKLLDYLLSPSGVELTTLGTVNVTYEYRETGGVDYINFSKNKALSIKELEEKFGLFIPGLYLSVDKKSPLLSYEGEELSAVVFLNKNDYVKEKKKNKILTDTVRERANQIITALDTKAYQFAIDYISGVGDTDYHKWLSEIKKQGADELYEIYNN